MKWYLAKIVFRIICGDGNHTSQFDEQLRLINANDPNEALTKAKAIGDREQDLFLNQQQQMVHWKFINVSELYQLREMIDGAELYSRIQEYDDATTYISNVHKKANHIQQQHTHNILELL